MDHKIGEIFHFDYQYDDWHIDIELEVVKSGPELCSGCYFYNKIPLCRFSDVEDIIGECGCRRRRDLKNVKFKQVDSSTNQTK